MENKLAVYQPQSLDDTERVAKAMAASGFFKDSQQAAQAIVKVLAGQELGFGPVASMTGIQIIQGRPTMSANLMAAAVKRSGKYDYRVIALTEERCEIAFFEGGKEIGRSPFTQADAQKAGTQNMSKFPRNMLFARAMSNGVKWYCPDIMSGVTVYTPDELGASVNDEGEYIEGQATEATKPAAPPTSAPQQPNPPKPDAAELDALGEQLWPGLWTDKRAAILSAYQGNAAKATAFCQGRMNSLDTPAELKKHVSASWPGGEALLDAIAADNTLNTATPVAVIGAIAKAYAVKAAQKADMTTAQLMAVVASELAIPAEFR